MSQEDFEDLAPAATFRDAKRHRLELAKHFDLRVGELAIDRVDARFSNDTLIQNLNAGPASLRKLTGRELALYRSGGASGCFRKLYSVPVGHRCPVSYARREALRSGEVDADDALQTLRELDEWVPTALIRVDLDHHRDPGHNDADFAKLVRDAETLADLINETFFDRNAYVERSPRGLGIYAILTLPKRRWHGEVSHFGTGWYVDSAKTLSENVKAFQTVLRDWARSLGFDCGLDVQGDPTVFRFDDHGKLRGIAKRGTLMRMPQLRSDGDVERFSSSRFEFDSTRNRILKVSRSAAPVVANKPTRAKTSRILTTGEKHEDSLRCVRRAIAATGLAEVHEIADVAMDLYESLGLNSGPRDARRTARFERLVRFCLANHEIEKHGGELRFTELDLARTETWLRSLVGEADLARHLARFGRADGSNKVGGLDKKRLYRQLAIVACTFPKDVYTGNRHEVPAQAILGMLKHFGFKVNGSTVAFLTGLLVELGWITKLSESDFGKCRKWTVSLDLIWTLPFLADVKARLIAEQNDRAGRNREATNQIESSQNKKDSYEVDQIKIPSFVQPTLSDPRLVMPAFLSGSTHAHADFACRFVQ